MTSVTDGYSVANAERFGWASVDRPNTERVEWLERAVVGRKVLDAGCGGGAYVDHLARRGFDVTGVDKHDMFLELARVRGLAGQFLEADLTGRLPFPDKAFDTTYCFDVLEHVDDVAALRELARVTRSRLIIAVPRDATRLEAEYRLTLIPYKDPTHLRYYAESDLRKLADTIAPKAVTVGPEQRVRVEQFVRHHATPRSRRPVLGRVYARLFDFLLRRAPFAVPGEPPPSMNWGVVIDLDEDRKDSPGPRPMED